MTVNELLPIKVVSQRTGLTQHVIRIWEKRYKAVLPSRSESNRRFYSNQEVSRLLLLRQAIEKGFTIGHLAKLSDYEISTILEKENQTIEKPFSDKAFSPTYPSKTTLTLNYLEKCILALQEMDASKLDKILTQAQLEITPQNLIEFLIIPFLSKIGELWQNGEIRIVHEHIASSVIRSFLGRLKSEIQTSKLSPKLIAATPVGQMHELGALLVALTAAYDGWDSVYLGPNLPAEEIAKAVEYYQASSLALSIIYPSDDPYLHLELKKLAKLVGEKTTLLVGGQGAMAYQNTLNSINAFLISDLKSLRVKLISLRNHYK
jgi:methanogenic corrinoid protein MtbC1